MRSSNPDLEYSNNNGVVAIKPTPTGKLRGLVLRTFSARDERVWIFMDYHTFQDDNGDLRLDHKSRGVSCGTYNDGERFLDLCRKLGLVVSATGFFVPFSNGQRRLVIDRTGKPMADYTETELKLMRWDLPTESQLRHQIEQDAASGGEPEHRMIVDDA